MDNLVTPIQHFIREDIREIKEIRRTFDRLTEKYDAAIQKYYSLAKSKEASALKEDAFQLYDIRKQFVKASLDYTYKVICFKQTVKNLVIDQVR